MDALKAILTLALIAIGLMFTHDFVLERHNDLFAPITKGTYSTSDTCKDGFSKLAAQYQSGSYLNEALLEKPTNGYSYEDFNTERDIQLSDYRTDWGTLKYHGDSKNSLKGKLTHTEARKKIAEDYVLEGVEDAGTEGKRCVAKFVKAGTGNVEDYWVYEFSKNSRKHPKNEPGHSFFALTDGRLNGISKNQSVKR